MSHVGGLAASPPLRYTLEVARGCTALAFSLAINGQNLLMAKGIAADYFAMPPLKRRQPPEGGNQRGALTALTRLRPMRGSASQSIWHLQRCWMPDRLRT
jgi:hypothetical protein